MSTTAKLGGYGLVLAAVLAAGLAAGAAAGPIDVGGSSEPETHTPTGFDGHEGRHP